MDRIAVLVPQMVDVTHLISCSNKERLLAVLGRLVKYSLLI